LTLKEIDQLTLEATEEREKEEEEETVLARDIGELLVLQRILRAKKGSREENQREHIFRSRCTVRGKVCSLIIDGGSYTNVASTHLVNKLSLPTIRHPRHILFNGSKKEIRFMSPNKF